MLPGHLFLGPVRAAAGCLSGFKFSFVAFPVLCRVGLGYECIFEAKRDAGTEGDAQRLAIGGSRLKHGINNLGVGFLDDVEAPVGVADADVLAQDA